MKRDDSLAKACKDLMLEEPFYGLFLIMLNKQWSENVKTAGVSIQDINYKLHINESFWNSLATHHRKGLLKHELLHIAFFHLTDFNHLKDLDVRNIAMDLEINQYIKPEMLPPGGQTLDLYPELELEPKKGTHYYYEKLMEGKNEGNCPNLNAMLQAMADGQGTIEINGSEIILPDHSEWQEVELDEATKRLIDNQTKHLMKEVADQVQKSRGTIPGELLSIFEKINTVEPPKFDWRGYLRRFAGGSIKTYTKKQRRKYNKRYEDNPGLKIKMKKHILVAIDTSGSVSDKELLEFMQEIHHIHRTGADVTIAQADTAIKNIAPYNPKSDYKIYGRGGTDFQPIIDYYNSNTRKYSSLIYLTDGEAPAPEGVRGRILWVLSTQSQMTDSLPGLTIKLN